MIPKNLENLTKLSFLDLGFNSYLHSDDVYWVSKVPLLQNLYLSDVFLGRAQNLFKVLSMLPSLLKLELMNCSITKMHNHDHQLVSYTNFSGLVSLNLANNGLDGPDLNAFRNMTSL